MLCQDCSRLRQHRGRRLVSRTVGYPIHSRGHLLQHRDHKANHFNMLMGKRGTHPLEYVTGKGNFGQFIEGKREFWTIHSPLTQCVHTQASITLSLTNSFATCARNAIWPLPFKSIPPRRMLVVVTVL